MADMSLTLGVTETGSYGNGFDGQTDEDGVVTASFEGTSDDLVLSFAGYDVDRADEIEVLLNGESLGFLSAGLNNGLADYSFTISAAQQLSGENEISFVQSISPGWTWGVTDVLLSQDGPPADMSLTLGVTETGSYGNGFDGQTDEDGVVTASFEGTSDDLVLSFAGYDVDRADEIEVLLNGESLGFLSAGLNNGLADYSFTISAAQQLSGENEISFVQSISPGWTWGVTDVLLVPAPTGPLVPDDPLYAEQWHLGMLGDIETVWGEYTGSGVSVGVYDDGVEYDHVDLDDNYDSSKHLSYDGSVLDPYPTTDDEAVHGTAVSGVIAAEANGVGTVGVAPGATLTGVNIFSGPADINASDKSGFYAASDETWQFDVVNLSWGSAPTFQNDVSQVTTNILADWDNALATGRGGLGTIIIKAAGNDGDNAQGDFLNAVRASISVGAYALNSETGLTDASWYTNRGANLLVSAPSSGKTVVVSGTNDLHSSSDLRIATTDRDGSFGYADDGAWSSSDDTSGFGGTSSATPVVSGVVALMLEANPDLGWRDVQSVLAYSAHHLGGPIGGAYGETETVPEYWLVPDGSTDMITVPVEYFGWDWNGADNWNGGGLHFSEDYGFGGVDAYNAVRMAEVWSLFGPAQVSTNEASASTGTMSPNLSVDTDPDTVTIPSSDTYEFTYSGGAMALEYVDIQIVLSSTYLKEVTLQITSPEGTTATLMDLLVNDYMTDLNPIPVDLSWTFGAHAFKGEDPNGTWTVTLTETDVPGDDSSGGTTGNTLDSLALSFYGRADGQHGVSLADDVYHYTSEMLSLGLAADEDRRILSDGAGEDWLNMAAMRDDLVVDLATDGSGGAEVAGGTQIEHAVTGDGADSLIGNGAANTLHGMRGDDSLSGLGGNDTLAGGRGNDEYWGGAGDDLFEFHLGDGADLIWDFVAGSGSEDVIALHGTGFMTFSSLTSTFSDNGVDTVIDFANGDTITLAGIASADLHEDDFLFYA